jgi:hypothetical protein
VVAKTNTILPTNKKLTYQHGTKKTQKKASVGKTPDHPPPSFTLLVFRKQKKTKTKNPPPSHCSTRPRRTLRSAATPRRWNLKEKTTTQRSQTRWVVPGREGSALLGPKVGRGWPRGYPRSMGRPRGHPRGLGVAFKPTLDPSRVGLMATPGPAQPPPVHEAVPRPSPGSGGGLRASPRSI